VTTLFTYTIPVDDGAAPNPFKGMCTLAICKPAIRRVAQPGDWVVGLGSKNAPSGDLSGHLVYAMRVEEVVSMASYDKFAKDRWRHRIPRIDSFDLAERLGDCIYDFSSGKAIQRPSVHGVANSQKDLGGRNVLISREVFYFGSCAIPLPRQLEALCHQTQGHRSRANDPYVEDFGLWLRGLNLEPGQLYGWPDYVIDWAETAKCGGCVVRADDDEGET